MKNLILGTIIISTLFFSSCAKDDDISSRSCETLERNAQDALILYNQEPTVETCIKYKEILQAQLNKNCLEGDAKVFLERLVSSLNCI